MQLHSCDSGNTGQCFDDWCNYGDICMAQDDASRALEHVDYAVAFDKGHGGIHSPHKSEVARRLATKVLALAGYGGSADTASGPVLVGACSTTQTRHPGSSTEPLAGDTSKNSTEVMLMLRNADGIKLRNTLECEHQTPVCCNSTSGGPPGAALGIAQIQLCDVWRGGHWYDAAVRVVSQPAALLLSAIVDTPPPDGATVCQVRMTMGAFPSCSAINRNGIPLAPLGPLAVSPACAQPAVVAVDAGAPTAPPTRW